MSGLFKKIGEEIRERFDRDNDKKDKEKQEEREAAPVAQETDSGTVESGATVGEAGTGSAVAESSSTAAPVPEAAGTTAPSTAEASVTATAPASAEGTVSGSGLDRTYTTKTGDTLEEIAAYFYGDRVQKQRLIDDNPFLTRYDGVQLPGGMQIHVSEDASRGDAVSTT